MADWSESMVSMEMDDESKLDYPMPATISGKPMAPDYPYGLRISLRDEELRKLKLPLDCKPGDCLVFRARACVKSVNECEDNDGDGNDEYNVELQIEAMSVED